MVVPVNPTDVTPGTTGSWQTVDLTSHVDAGNTEGVILVFYSDLFTPRTFGARHPDSTDDPKGDIQNTFWTQWFAGVNSSDEVEIYVENADVTVEIVGYIESDAGEFFDDPISNHEYTPSTTGDWTSVDISGDTTGTAVLSFWLVTNPTGTYHQFGLRETGSSDNRIADFNRTEGTRDVRGHAMAVDSNETLEIYQENTDLNWYLLGYLTDGFTSIGPDATDHSASSTGTTVADLSDDVPSDATGVWMHSHATDYSDVWADFRHEIWENGATNPYDTNVRTRQQYFFVEVDGSQRVQQTIASLDRDLYLWGHSKEAEGVQLAADLTASGTLDGALAVPKELAADLSGSGTLDGRIVNINTITTTLPNAKIESIDSPSSGELKITLTDTTNYGDYRFQLRDGDATEWSSSATGWAEATESSDSDTSGTVSHTFSDLDPGAAYDTRVRSETEHREGSWQTRTDVSALDSPQGLSVSTAYSLDVFPDGSLSIPSPGYDPDNSFALELELAPARNTIDASTTMEIVSSGDPSFLSGLEIENGDLRLTWDDESGTEHTIGGFDVTGWAPTEFRTYEFGYNGTAQSLFEDGSVVWSDDTIGAVNPEDIPGALNFGGDWEGWIGQIKLWIDGELAGQWLLNEGSGTTATDTAGSNDGSLTGAEYDERDPTTHLALAWTPSTDQTTGQKIMRARQYDSGFGGFSEIDDIDSNAEAYTDGTVSPGNTYRYKVRAYVEGSADSATADGTTDSVDVVRDSNVIPTGWYVEVDHPDGRTLRPTILDEAQPLRTVNGLPRVRIPVRRDEAWLDPKFEDGVSMRVWEDGFKLPIEELRNVEMEPGRSVLVGIGGVELEQRIEHFAHEVETHSEAESLVESNTNYDTNFDDPQGTVTSSVAMQDADSTADWQSVLSAHPPSDSDLWYVEDGELKTRQTGYFAEAEGSSVSAGGWTEIIGFDNDVSNDRAIQAGTNEGDVTFTFETDHDIPQSNFDIRWRLQFFQANQPEFDFEFDGSVMETFSRNATITNETSMGWTSVTDVNNVLPDPIPAGEHTVSLSPNEDVGANDDNFYIDCVAVVDDRGNQTFGSTTNSDDALPGPEEYPESVGRLETTDAVSAEQVVAGRLEVDANNVTGGEFQLAISNDPGSSWVTASNVSAVNASFGSGTGQIRAGFTLSRYSKDTTTTPYNGDAGQAIDLYTLFADLDDTPQLYNETVDDSLLGILQGWAEASGQVFEVTRNGSGTIQIEWTTPGQRTDDRSDTVLDYSVSKENLNPWDEVVVRGASRKRSSESFTSNHDTFVNLEKSYIKRGSESVYDGSNTYDENDDYEMNYKDGQIKVLSSGDMSDSTSFDIDYNWEARGSHPQSGLPSNPRTKVAIIPGLTDERECDQIARTIYKDIQAPLYAVETVLDSMDPTELLVDDILFDGVPTNATRAVIRSIEPSPGRVALSMGSRERVGDVIDDIRNRVSAVVKTS